LPDKTRSRRTKITKQSNNNDPETEKLTVNPFWLGQFCSRYRRTDLYAASAVP